MLCMTLCDSLWLIVTLAQVEKIEQGLTKVRSKVEVQTWDKRLP